MLVKKQSKQVRLIPKQEIYHVCPRCLHTLSVVTMGAMLKRSPGLPCPKCAATSIGEFIAQYPGEIEWN